MELSWTELKDVPAEPEGSAYAEFWLYAPGTAEPLRAVAGVVRHIGPMLEELLRSVPKQPPPRDDPPTGCDDTAATAS